MFPFEAMRKEFCSSVGPNVFKSAPNPPPKPRLWGVFSFDPCGFVETQEACFRSRTTFLMGSAEDFLSRPPLPPPPQIDPFFSTTLSLLMNIREAAFIGAAPPPFWDRDWRHFCLAEELYRFLAAFSVRPGRSFEISHQRVPKNSCRVERTNIRHNRTGEASRQARRQVCRQAMHTVRRIRAKWANCCR